MPCFDLLLYLNRELFSMIENSIDIDLLTGLYATQLSERSERELLDHNRVYYRLLRKIVLQGQARNELTSEMNAGEIVRLYALCERALLYDWCLCRGDYSLKDHAVATLPRLLKGIIK